MHKTLFFTILLFSTVIFMSSCERNDYEEWKMLNDAWWAENRDSLENAGYQTTESGLMYKIENKGAEEQRFPGGYSQINVSYTGKLIDGKTFQSAEKVGLSMSSVVAGWTEGLKKIQTGGIIHLYIPYFLGYGKEGSGAIPPYSTLYFKIQLHQSYY